MPSIKSRRVGQPVAPQQVSLWLKRQELAASHSSDSYSGPVARDLGVGRSRRLFGSAMGAHSKIAESPFFVAVRAGKVSRSMYLRYMADNLAICDAIERVLCAHGTHPALAGMAALHFNRSHHFRADLERAGGAGAAPSHAAANLAALIDALGQDLDDASASAHTGADNGPLIAAHAWVQYQAMLFGGQTVIRAKFKEQFGATAFDFPGNTVALIHACAAAIDAMRVSPEREAALEMEVGKAFVANRLCLESLTRLARL